jgi:hypothetical protein
MLYGNEKLIWSRKLDVMCIKASRSFIQENEVKVMWLSMANLGYIVIEKLSKSRKLDVIFNKAS